MYHLHMTDLLKKKTALLAVALIIVLCQGCTRLRDIRVVSCGVESVSIQGMRGLSAVLGVGVDNPAGTMTLSEISGRAYIQDRLLGEFSSDDVEIAGRTVSECRIPVTFTLDRDISLLGLLPLVRSLDTGSVTVDISMKVKMKGGVSKRFRFERLPVSHILRDSNLQGDPHIRDLFL